MTDLKEYDVPAPSGSGTIRVQLSEAEAKRHGVFKDTPKAKKAAAPANKAKKAASNKKA